jgi:hypothetical protein
MKPYARILLFLLLIANCAWIDCCCCCNPFHFVLPSFLFLLFMYYIHVYISNVAICFVLLLRPLYSSFYFTNWANHHRCCLCQKEIISWCIHSISIISINDILSHDVTSSTSCWHWLACSLSTRSERKIKPDLCVDFSRPPVCRRANAHTNTIHHTLYIDSSLTSSKHSPRRCIGF